MKFRSLILGLATAPFLSAAAQAAFELPDCAATIAWSGGIDLSDRQVLNPSTTLGFPKAFLGDEMAGLYGKPGPDFAPDEVVKARQAAKDCGAQAGSRDEKKMLAALEKEFARGLGPTLQAMAKAGAELEVALDDFAAAPAGLDKASVIIGFRAMVDWDRKAYNAAVRRIDRNFRKIADRIGRALADLPQAQVAQRVLPSMEPQYDESMATVLAELRQQIAAIDASEKELRTFDRTVSKIAKPLADVLPADEMAVIEQDFAARKLEMEETLIAEAAGSFAALPATVFSLRQIESAASRGLAAALTPESAEAYIAMLRERRQALALALVEAVPPQPGSLTALPQLRQELHNSPGGLAGESELAAIDQAVAEKQAIVGQLVAQDLLKQIAEVPVESKAFLVLDRHADERVLKLLGSDDAEAVRQAATQRRVEVDGELYAILTDELENFDDSEKSLAVIDTILLPDIQTWPASAGDYKAKYQEAVLGKRVAILEVLTEAESGPLQGRVYADSAGSLKLEFVEDDRVYVTAGGDQTVVAPYEEDGETRVLVTMPQGTLVFTREARWLTGGPRLLERIDKRP